jgi:hypothetical protein
VAGVAGVVVVTVALTVTVLRILLCFGGVVSVLRMDGRGTAGVLRAVAGGSGGAGRCGGVSLRGSAGRRTRPRAGPAFPGRAGREGRRVTGLAHGLEQVLVRDVRGGGDLRRTERKVHAGLDAVEFAQLAFDPPDAGSAGHPLDGEVDDAVALTG